MAVTASGRVQVTMSGNLADVRDQGTATYPGSLQYSRAFQDGNVVNQFNLLFDDDRSLTSSQTENVDLNAALTDAFGRSFAATKIRAIGLVAPATNTVDITFGNHATAAWVGPWGATGTCVLSPDGCIFCVNPTAAGWPVVATTADMLKVVNGAAASTYKIMLFGSM